MENNLDNNLGSLIKKALEYFDEQNYKYYNNVQNEYGNFSEQEILGYYDNQNKIWVWGWVLPYKLEDISLCNKLINYGLNIDPFLGSEDHIFIKSLLLNSRLKLDNIIELEIHLAICSYILKNNIKFIYPKKYYIDNTSIINNTYYYLIKNI